MYTGNTLEEPWRISQFIRPVDYFGQWHQGTLDLLDTYNKPDVVYRDGKMKNPVFSLNWAQSIDISADFDDKTI